MLQVVESIKNATLNLTTTNTSANNPFSKLASLGIKLKADAKSAQTLSDIASKNAQKTADAETKAALVESKDREIRVIKESQQRQQTLGELLKPLNKDKQTVMVSLLENVQTDKLKSAFEKYLPAVLNNSAAPKAEKPAMLAESRVEVTGDKSAKVSAENNDSNVVEIKRLAGLK